MSHEKTTTPVPAQPSPRNNFTTPEEDRIIEAAFQEVRDGYLKSNHRKKVEIIERAYRFAKEAHSGIRRRSGEPYILHPIAVPKSPARKSAWDPHRYAPHCSTTW